MRRVFFWSHFALGLVAALFIFVMSVTGALLSFESQATNWARNAAITAPSDAEPLGLAGLIAAAEAQGAAPGQTLTIASDPSNAAQLAKSRRDVVWLNPYDGSALEDPAVAGFFGWVEGVHRWFSLAGGRSAIGGWLMQAGNLVFAVILLTGIVIWWPRKWKWSFLRRQIGFQKGLPTRQARYFNWHHVLAFWSLVPLLAVVLSGVLISYSWASGPVYALFGTAQSAEQAVVRDATEVQAGGGEMPLDQLAALAVEGLNDWKRLSITLPGPQDETVDFVADRGNGVAPYAKDTIRVTRDGSSVEVLLPAPTNPRFFVRFLHTGEVFGMTGQLLAGLASVAAAVLVYTGVFLGIGRLRRMQLRRRQAACA